jgi:hypothetical protein
MGSIRRAPRTNRWEARYRDPTGRQRTATFARKRDAVAFLGVTETDKRRGEWLEPEASRITLRQWHDRWWPTVENSDRAANTLVQYESILRVHVLPHLGDRRMATLHRIDVEEWLAALRAGALGSSATRTARTLLGMMLSSAVESRILRSNPLAGVKVARRGPTRAKQALTIPQVEGLADAAEPYRVLVLVLAYCGLRPNEAGRRGGCGGGPGPHHRDRRQDAQGQGRPAPPLRCRGAGAAAGHPARGTGDVGVCQFDGRPDRSAQLPPSARRGCGTCRAARVGHAVHVAPHVRLADGPAGRPGDDGRRRSWGTTRPCSSGSTATSTPTTFAARRRSSTPRERAIFAPHVVQMWCRLWNLRRFQALTP